MKLLVDPFWLPLLVLVTIWVVLWRRKSLSRWMRIGGTTALCALWFLSTPAGVVVLEWPLAVGPTIDAGWKPDYIYVLSAGFDIGDVPEHDSSGLETIRRVNRATELWKQYPTATLIMAGTQPGMGDLRDPQQQGLLMQAQAERLGVPPAKILIDSVSTNTNGHAKVARDSGLHNPDSPLLIVTSDFHLRRARREFSRFFDNVRLVGSDTSISKDSFGDLLFRSLMPDVNSLKDATVCWREYVALALSDLRN